MVMRLSCPSLESLMFNARNDRLISLVAFIDFNKAFDSIHRGILLNKLKDIGIDYNILCWIERYLSDRKQCTIANGKLSQLLLTCFGVPQGSVLGPLLFLIYINSLSDSIIKCKVFLYAEFPQSRLSCPGLQLISW